MSKSAEKPAFSAHDDKAILLVYKKNYVQLSNSTLRHYLDIQSERNILLNTKTKLDTTNSVNQKTT